MPATPARVIAAADDVVAAIAEAWSPSGSDAVSREYFAAVTEKELASLTGRKVFVFPDAYDSGPVTRGEDGWIHSVGVIVVERYEGVGRPPKDWLDERVAFVEQTVLEAVNFDGREGLLGGKLTLREAPVTEVYLVSALHEAKCFWSEIELQLEEIVEA